MIQVRRLAGSPKTRACPMKLIRLRAKTTVRLQCRLSLSLTVTGLAAAACMIMGCFLPEAVSGKDGLARLLEKAETQVVARNLHTPWAMDFTPDGRILLTERPGRIRIVREDRLLPEAWMTLGDVDDELACGLLGLAVDPHFSSNRFVYAAYTYRTTEGHLRDRLVRLRERADGKGAVDRVLLEYGIPGGSQHHGGCVKFGPDGKLYWTTGDLGRPEISQDRSHLAGKILRLNPDGSVPSDNPFSESPVYSYGHRNPQGLAWQPGTRDLYVVDHGPSFRDELNRVEVGGNYGWPEITAEQSYGWPEITAEQSRAGIFSRPAQRYFQELGAIQRSLCDPGPPGWLAALYRTQGAGALLCDFRPRRPAPDRCLRGALHRALRPVAQRHPSAGRFHLLHDQQRRRVGETASRRRKIVAVDIARRLVGSQARQADHSRVKQVSFQVSRAPAPHDGADHTRKNG